MGLSSHSPLSFLPNAKLWPPLAGAKVPGTGTSLELVQGDELKPIAFWGNAGKPKSLQAIF